MNRRICAKILSVIMVLTLIMQNTYVVYGEEIIKSTKVEEKIVGGTDDENYKIQLSNQYGVDSNNITTMQNNYGDIYEVEYNLSEINKFVEEKNIDKVTEEKFIACMLIGYKAVDTTSLYYLATALGTTIDSIWKEDYGLDNSAYIESINIYNDEEKEYLKRLNIKEALDIRKIVQYCMYNNISPLQLKERIIEYDLLRLEQEQNIRPLNAEPIKNFDENSFNKYFVAPFNVNGNGEIVSENTGNLSLSNLDYTLQGRNGLHLNIGTTYRSNNSNLYDYDVESTYYSDTDYRVSYTKYKKNEYKGDITEISSGSKYCGTMSGVEDFIQWLEDDTGIIDTKYKGRVLFDKWKIDGTKQIYAGPIVKLTSLCDSEYEMDREIERVIHENEGWHDNFKYIWNYKDAYRYSYDVYTYYDVYVEKIDNSYTSYSDSTKAKTFSEKRYALGSGWGFNFSSIEIYGNNKYLHLGNGQQYKIEYSNGKYTLKEYKLKDLDLKEDTSYSYGNETSKYVLEYKNGNKEYFTSDGRIIAIKHQQNNAIKFTYKTYNNEKVINTIIDTLDRVITFEYKDITSNVHGNELIDGRKVQLNLPDGTNIKYFMKPIVNETNEYTLYKKVDQLGRETIYEYDITDYKFSIIEKRYSSGSNKYALLDLIEYTTGAKSFYNYEKAEGNFGKDGIKQYYRVISRSDKEDNAFYNESSYDYSENDYTGYPKEKNPESLSTTFTYGGKKFIGDVVEEYSFNNNNLKTSTTIKNNRGKLLSKTEFTYDQYELPSGTKTYVYDRNNSSNNRVVSTNSVYDQYGNLTSHTDENGNTSIYEYYTDKYHTLKKETKDVDKSKGIKSVQENTIVDPMGNVIQKTIYHTEYNMPKNTTINYKYDSYGNLIEEKSAMTDGKEVVKKYEYSPVYKNAYVTKMIEKTTDYDNISKDIVNEFAYNINNGQLLSSTSYVTDTLGTKVARTQKYEYDSLGRITKNINPDNTFKTIEYDRDNNPKTNEVIKTLENGYKVKNIYDGLGKLIEVQDNSGSNNAWVTLEKTYYDSLGQIQWKEDAKGNRTTFSYDELGRVISTLNSDGTSVRASYDDYRNSKKVISEVGSVAEEVYDNKGNVKESIVYTNTNGQGVVRVQNEYNAIGKPTKITDPKGNVTTNEYDDLGRLIKVRNPLGEETIYRYDNMNNLVEMTTAGIKEGTTTTKREYNQQGQVTKEINALNQVELFKYDEAGAIIKKVDKAGKTTIYRYDNRGRIIEEAFQDGTKVTYGYSDSLNDKSIIKSKAGALIEKNYYKYNLDGTLKLTWVQDGNNVQKTIQYLYDNNKNKTQTIDQLGNATKYEYDNRNRLIKVTDSDQSITGYTYTLDSKKDITTLPNGNKEDVYYNDLGQVKSIINTDKTGKVLTQYDYTYDLNGNRTYEKEQINVNGLMKTKETGYAYDSLNRVDYVNYPYGIKEHYTYDKNSNIEKKEKRVGNCLIETEDFMYDKSNKLINKESVLNIKKLTIKPDYNVLSKDNLEIIFTLSVELLDASEAPKEIFENVIWSSECKEFKINKLNDKQVVGTIKLEDLNKIKDKFTLTASIGGMNSSIEVIKKKENAKMKNIKINYEESLVYSNVKRLWVTGKYDDGTEIEPSILEQVQWSTDTTSLESKYVSLSPRKGKETIVEYKFNPWKEKNKELSQRAEIKSPNYSEAEVIKVTVLAELMGVKTSVNLKIYDTYIPVRPPNTGIFELPRTMNNMKNTTGSSITFKEDEFEKVIIITVENVEESHNDSIMSVTTNSSINMNINELFKMKLNEINMNAEANIQKKDVGGLYQRPPKNEIDEEQVQVLTPTSGKKVIFKYDENGNLITKSIDGQIQEEFTYNGLNQLVAYKNNNTGMNSTYDYYADGLRKSKTVNGEKTIFFNDGQNVIIETDGSYNLKARYTLGLGYIRRADAKNNKYYYLYDAHGDVTVLTDSEGNIVKSYDYDIYGQEKESEYLVDIENSIRYTGQYFDEESGLYYLRARYYSPEIMRFISEDTYKGKIDNPLSLNYYLYCYGNPVMLSDPTGNDPFRQKHMGAAREAIDKEWGSRVRYSMQMWEYRIQSLKQPYIDSVMIYGDDPEEAQKFADAGFFVMTSYLGGKVTSGGTSINLSTQGACKSDELTSLFRAVGPDEFYDVMKTGEFSVIPQGLQAKQFGLSFDETLKFAEKYSDIGAILEIKVPTNMLDDLADFTQVDRFIFKNGTVTIHLDQLDDFNKIIKEINHKY